MIINIHKKIPIKIAQGLTFFAKKKCLILQIQYKVQHNSPYNATLPLPTQTRRESISKWETILENKMYFLRKRDIKATQGC